MAAELNRPRVAIYARYSSDLQRPTSIEDQIRNCRAAAERNGWTVLEEFIRFDSETTGRTLVGREEITELIRIAQTTPRPFDGIVIDDSSRFGRYLPDVLRECDVLEYHNVFVHFATDKLDSRDESFRIVHLIKGYGDERYIKDLSAKVRRGQTGCALKGYLPCGKTYGYRNVNIEDPTGKPDHGRPAVEGVIQVIIPEQRDVLVRMGEMYAAGASYKTIARTFNAERIPTPRPPRKGKVAAWTPSTIGDMLRNELYRGIRIWNRTYRVFNPRKGKAKQRQRPESEWIRKEIPELRIFSEELWQRICERKRLVREKHGITRIGGMNRTANSRMYLVSGLLVCGSCGGSITIVGGKPPYARYGCKNHRFRALCEDGTVCGNKVTIAQRKLERQLIAALAAKLSDSRLHDELVESFCKQLQKVLDNESKAAREASSRQSELKEEQSRLNKQAANLVSAIAEYGMSDLLKAQLAEVEARLKEIERLLDAKTDAKLPAFSADQIREFLRRKSQDFASVLAGDPAKAKQELQKRITKLVLTPKNTPNGTVLEVTGDVALFVREEDVMQTDSLERIGLHYIQPAAFVFNDVLDPRIPLAA